MRCFQFILIISTIATFAGHCAGHVSFTIPTGEPGETVRTQFRIGHGCNGKDTKLITIAIPDGIYGTKPEQIPGYEITTTMKALDPPIEKYGKLVNETVDVITYTGVLPDSQYRLFGLQMTLPKVEENTTLSFTTVQDCGDEKLSWDDSSDSSPAPKFKVVPVVEGSSTTTEPDKGSAGSHGPTSAAIILVQLITFVVYFSL